MFLLIVHSRLSPRWFSPGTPASSTTKTGRYDIAEILLKVAFNTKYQIKSNPYLDSLGVSFLSRFCIISASSTNIFLPQPPFTISAPTIILWYFHFQPFFVFSLLAPSPHFLPQTPFRHITALTPPPFFHLFFFFRLPSTAFKIIHSCCFVFIIVIYVNKGFFFMFCYFYLVFYVLFFSM